MVNPYDMCAREDMPSLYGAPETWHTFDVCGMLSHWVVHTCSLRAVQ
jgi:hypothetical protein